MPEAFEAAWPDQRATRRRTIYDDPFIRQYIEDLLLNIRAQVSWLISASCLACSSSCAEAS